MILRIAFHPRGGLTDTQKENIGGQILEHLHKYGSVSEFTVDEGANAHITPGPRAVALAAALFEALPGDANHAEIAECVDICNKLLDLAGKFGREGA